MQKYFHTLIEGERLFKGCFVMSKMFDSSWSKHKLFIFLVLFSSILDHFLQKFKFDKLWAKKTTTYAAITVLSITLIWYRILYRTKFNWIVTKIRFKYLLVLLCFTAKFPAFLFGINLQIRPTWIFNASTIWNLNTNLFV